MSRNLRRCLAAAGVVLALAGLAGVGWHFGWLPGLAPKPSPFIGVADLLLEMKSIKSSQPTDPADQLQLDLTAFQAKALDLPPDEAAAQWTALYDRAIALKPQSGSWGDKSKVARVRTAFIDRVPGATAWPAMEKLIEARPEGLEADRQSEVMLRFLVHTLNNEEEKQWHDLDALYRLEPPNAQAATTTANSSASAPPSLWLPLGEHLCQVATNGKAIADFWDKAIARFEPAPPSTPTTDAGARSSPTSPPAGHYFRPAGTTLDLPDLVPLVGAEQATALLQRALVLPDARVNIPRGAATQKLARDLALGLIDPMQQPPWGLTGSPEGVPLFEALAKKFGRPGEPGAGTLFEKFALIEQGEWDRALVTPVSVPSSLNLDDLEQVAMTHLYAGGHGGRLYDFYQGEVLRGENEWTRFLDVAGKLGRTDEALKTLGEVLANPALPDAARNLAQIHRFQALLANDQVGEGLAALAKCRDLPAASHEPGDTYPYFWKIETRISMALAAARVGLITQDQATFDANMFLMVDLYKAAAATRENLTTQELDDLSGVIDLLIQKAHFRDAEVLLHMLVEAEVARSRTALEKGEPDAILKSELLLMTTFYYEGQDWDDVLALVKDFPYWAESDLAGLPYDQGRLGNSTTFPLQLMAARSLAKKGRVAEARPLLDEVLQVFPANDQAYSFLLEIEGDPVPKLDALYAEDRFEKRPLIWKAAVLLRQHNYEDAEKVCRQAIAIDPSDGQEGKVDRMRAYAVLAEILQAKGEHDEAAKMKALVEAIRMSEQADDLYQAWLFTRATKLYGQALGLFSDAYCIESRLAKRLTELGKSDEAATHYRRAFELMPGSFGRMESHCFGCEGVFDGGVAQDAAEQVFAGLMKQEPVKAQVPYLLGMLRLEQGRAAEAVPLFQKAAELDPDYVNAWMRLLQLDKTEALSPALCDAAVLAQIRLVPQGRHGFLDVAHVRALAQVWKAKMAADKSLVTRWPPHLFAMEASRALLEKNLTAKVKGTISTPNFELRLTGSMSPLTDPKPDGDEVLNGNDLVQAIRQAWRDAYQD